MIGHTHTRIPALVLYLAVLAGLSGCAVGGGGGPSRGNLSEATAAAAEKEGESGEEQAATRSRDDLFPSDEDADYISDYYDEDTDIGGSLLAAGIAALFSGDDDEASSEGDSRDTEEDTFAYDRDNLNLWYSRSQLAGDAIRSFSTWTLMYSSFLEDSDPPFRGQFGLYYGRGQKGGQPDIQEGIRWISEAGADLGFRNYLTSRRSRMGFYVLYGLRAGVLFWSYSNPIEVSAEGGGVETISGDQLFLLTPYAGIGTSLLQTKAVHFGLSLTAGARFSVGKTFQGFENDVFKDVGEIKLNFEASVFF